MEYFLPVSTSYHLPAYGWKSNYCVCVVQFSEVVELDNHMFLSSMVLQVKAIFW